MKKSGATGIPKADLIEDLRFTLRRVLKWAEAYEPSGIQKRTYDADLDAAEALLRKVDARMSSSTPSD
jgi:hypothetical protein